MMELVSVGDTTGYRIDYTTGGGSSGSQPVSGGGTNSYTLTGLIRRETYVISIVGTSEHCIFRTLCQNRKL